MNNITLFIIRDDRNDIRCESLGHNENTGKWAGAVNLYKNKFFHSTLLSTGLVFDSEEEAIEHMEGVVQSVRRCKEV
ncbi:hypothetical protein ACFL08_03465 [Patescibacteria group bacterium]